MVGVTFATRGSVTAINFLTGILLARLLGPEARGEYAFLILLPELASSVGGLGLHEAITYHTALRGHGPEKVLGTAVAMGLGLGILYAALLALAFFAQLLPVSNHRLPELLIALGAIPLVRTLVYLQAFLRGREDFSGYNGILLLRATAYALAIAVTLIPLDAGLRGALVGFLGSIVAAMAYALLRIRKHLQTAPAFDWCFLKHGLAFGIRVWPGSVTSVLSRRVDFIILFYLAGPQALGQYAVATQMAEAPLAFPAAVATVLMPRLTLSRSGALGLVRRWLHIQFLFFLVVAAGFVILGPIFVPKVFGEEFLPAYGVALALLPGLLALSWSTVLSSFFAGVGRPLVNTGAALVGLCLALPTYVALIPLLGAMGAAVASSASYAVQVSFQWLRLGRSKSLAVPK